MCTDNKSFLQRLPNREKSQRANLLVWLRILNTSAPLPPPPSPFSGVLHGASALIASRGSWSAKVVQNQYHGRGRITIPTRVHSFLVAVRTIYRPAAITQSVIGHPVPPLYRLSVSPHLPPQKFPSQSQRRFLRTSHNNLAKLTPSSPNSFCSLHLASPCPLSAVMPRTCFQTSTTR